MHVSHHDFDDWSNAISFAFSLSKLASLDRYVSWVGAANWVPAASTVSAIFKMTSWRTAVNSVQSAVVANAHNSSSKAAPAKFATRILEVPFSIKGCSFSMICT